MSMQFSDLIDALKIECPKTPDRAIMVFITHLQKAKVEAGPALAEAYERWGLKRTTRSLPLPIEFLAFYSAPDAEPVHPADEPSVLPDPEKWADEYLRSDHGQAAILSGVGYDCKVYCLQNPGKRPSFEYIDEMKAAKVKNMTETLPRLRDAQMRDRDRPNDGTVAFGLTGSLIRLWDTMEARNEELGREYRRVPAA